MCQDLEGKAEGVSLKSRAEKKPESFQRREGDSGKGHQNGRASWKEGHSNWTGKGGRDVEGRGTGGAF